MCRPQPSLSLHPTSVRRQPDRCNVTHRSTHPTVREPRAARPESSSMAAVWSSSARAKASHTLVSCAVSPPAHLAAAARRPAPPSQAPRRIARAARVRALAQKLAYGRCTLDTRPDERRWLEPLLPHSGATFAFLEPCALALVGVHGLRSCSSTPRSSDAAGCEGGGSGGA